MDSGITESFVKVLAKEQLLPITWVTAGSNSQLVGLTKEPRSQQRRECQNKVGQECISLNGYGKNYSV